MNVDSPVEIANKNASALEGTGSDRKWGMGTGRCCSFSLLSSTSVFQSPWKPEVKPQDRVLQGSSNIPCHQPDWFLPLVSVQLPCPGHAAVCLWYRVPPWIPRVVEAQQFWLAAFLKLVSALCIPPLTPPAAFLHRRESSPEVDFHSDFWNSNLIGHSVFLFAKPSNPEQKEISQFQGW